MRVLDIYAHSASEAKFRIQKDRQTGDISQYDAEGILLSVWKPDKMVRL